MSDQEKTRVGSAHPSPPSVAANLTGGAPMPPDGPVSRQPQESTIVGPAPVVPNRRTMVGVAANRAAEATVVGSVGAQQRDPIPPSTLAGGTPPPGSTPAFVPPPLAGSPDPNALQASTLGAAPRAKRSTSGPSQPSITKSAWDTFASATGESIEGTTGVHAPSATPHPGV